MLEARGIEKRYGKVVALRGADLDVGAGSVVSLLGRNGAGKTTLLSTIAGLLRPDAGSVLVDGVDVWAQPGAAASLIGIAPQETGIYRAVTVRDNLVFFAELAGLRRSARNRRVEEVAEQLALTDLLGRKATQLSGGEARRLHTACALVHRPRLLLLDEPTVGADVITRNQLIEVVRQLAADGAAVLYTTHYLPEVEALAAEIVVIDDGVVLARGTQRELVERYRSDGVEIEFDRAVDALPTGLQGERLNETRWRCGSSDDVGYVTSQISPLDARIVSAELIRPDLERVFLAITGSTLEDDSTIEEETV
ncbi:MAG: ABC transporter ATP-binding protein [Actinomycetia bacterium]|nr:ABC transporter ATP-binding protein [Actinomycetes bacterium]MCP5034932.1 ABC transporter ATP-binding protein [Actinomycetes bacterium]